MRGHHTYQIVHTCFNLIFDVEGKTAQGYIEMVFMPQPQPQSKSDRDDKQNSLNGGNLSSKLSNEELSSLSLNFQRCANKTDREIHKVYVDGVEAKFCWKQPQVARPKTNVKEVRDLKNYDALFNEELDLMDEGELQILIPKNVSVGKPLQRAHNPSTSELDRLYETITIRIEYSLNDPRYGMHFTRYASSPHVFTYNSSWHPCVNSLTDRSSFYSYITVASKYTVVCSGDLKEKRCANPEGTMITWIYEVSPIPTKHYALAIGEFEVLPGEEKLQKLLTSFCPSGIDQKEQLAFSVTCVPRAFAIYEEYLQQGYPFSTYKQVFVDEAFQESMSFAGMSIFSSSLLHDSKQIEQAYETRSIIARSLALSWVQECVTIIRSYADIWFVAGIAGVLHSMFVKREFGHAEVEYQKTKYRVHIKPHEKEHPNKNVPLRWDGYGHPCELDMDFINEKSLLVMQMLEYQMKGPDSFKNFISKEMQHPSEKKPKKSSDKKNNIDRLIIKHLGKDGTGRDFFDKWIRGVECPPYTVGIRFNTRSKRTDFHFAVHNKKHIPRQRVAGQIRIRVHEQHEKMFEEQRELHGGSGEEVKSISFRGKPIKRTKRKKDDDSTGGTAGCPVKWIRLDPEYEWLMSLEVYQSHQLSITQLQNDKDVKSQIEALHALYLKCGSQGGVNALADAMQCSDYYWKVRVFAAQALADIRDQNRDYALLPLIRSVNQRGQTYFDDHGIVKPNNFSNFSEFFLQKEIPMILSGIRDQRDSSLDAVIELLITLLKENDNSQNDFSDDFYVAHFITALGNLRFKQHDAGRRHKLHVQQLIKRYLDRDTIRKSFRNVVTQACLTAHSNLERAEQIQPFINYMSYIRPGIFEDVQVTAFKCLVNVSPLTPIEKGSHVFAMLKVLGRVQGKRNKSRQDEKHGLFAKSLWPPGVRRRFYEVWAKTYEEMYYQYQYNQNHLHQQRPIQKLVNFNHYQRDDQFVFLVMEFLWDVLTTDPIYEIRRYVYDIYKVIWGDRSPPCALPQHGDLTGVVEQDRQGTNRRRLKAHEELQSLAKPAPLASTYTRTSTRRGSTTRSSYQSNGYHDGGYYR